MKLRTILLFTLLTTPLGLFAEDDPARILCVGDSITQGGRADRPEYTYRYPLQQKLHAAGIPFDFIGSRQAGLQPDATWPEVAPGVPFDPDHEGYYGNTTAEVVRKVEAAWTADSPTPDIVLIHLGTNDQKASDYVETVQAPLRQFIDFIRGKNPHVVILLGHLNFNDSEGAAAIRPLVQALAEDLSTEASPIATVAHYEGWQENPDQPDTDTFDWAHPNPQGQEKMATRWFTSIQSNLPKSSQ